MSSDQKYYVVWQGKVPGIYTDWRKTQSVIQGFPNAKYKSFKTRKEAEAAYRLPWESYYAQSSRKPSYAKHSVVKSYADKVLADSVCVDAACSGNPGRMEYRGVRTLTGEELFHSEVYPMGTNNIGEFLAIVHALAMWSEKHPKLTIYTDSVNAMSWVKRGICKTKLPENAHTQHLHNVITRAENWLASHKWSNPIVKWETEEWGEIPADFGRK